MRYLLLGFVALSALAGCTSKLVGNNNYMNDVRNPGKFSRLETDGAFDVVLTNDTGYAVQVYAESNIMPEIVTDVQGSALVVSYKNDMTNIQHGDMVIKVPAHALKTVSLAGSGSIVAEDTLKADNLEAFLIGSGKLDLLVSGTYITADLSGSGDILLKGHVNSSKITISGSGDIKSFDMTSNASKVDIGGSGDADVSVSQILDVNIAGSGNVRYNGSPAVTSNITGSGKVKQH
jgi:hypothetical protein